MIDWPCIACGSNDRYKSGKCKSCAKGRAKKWLLKNKEAVADAKKAYAQTNKEKIAEYQKAYRKANADKLKQQGKEKRLLNSDLLKERSKKYYENNKESCIKRSSIYQRENREKRREYSKQYRKSRSEKDVLFRLSILYRTRTYQAFAFNGFDKKEKVKALLGCDWQTFKLHIEKQFKPGMTWDNHSVKGWHLDHIKPLCSATTQEELRSLCHYKNLQPLWAIENLSKNGKTK